MWKQIDRQTDVMDVPGGVVIRCILGGTGSAESSRDFSVAMVFVPGAKASAFVQNEEWDYS